MYGYDSDDEGPAEQLDENGFTPQENEFFKKVTRKERGAPLFRDLSITNKAVVDGGLRLGLFEPTPFPKFGDPKPKDEDENDHLKKDIKFACLGLFKIWLSDYAVRNHRPFAIDHSDQNLRYKVNYGKVWKAKANALVGVEMKERGIAWGRRKQANE
ncbi:hypothetical protein D1007_55448 [Hordeum vulgare]|nr:hypothetical protein D1007_55448 [Hordeum vulgare]